jgi:CDP-diacylglycerol--serine O-phosphatidyltransferase
MFFGFYSIVASIKGDFEHAAWAILTATIFDARSTAGWQGSPQRAGSAWSSIRSDLVSFGVAPALMFYIWALMPFKRWGWVGAFLFVVCGALRLARFNVQMTGSERKWFTGLPIPGGAAVLATTVIFYNDTFGNVAPDRSFVLLVMTYVTAILMISTVKFHSLKELNVRTGAHSDAASRGSHTCCRGAQPRQSCFRDHYFYVLWRYRVYIDCRHLQAGKSRPNR